MQVFLLSNAEIKFSPLLNFQKDCAGNLIKFNVLNITFKF